MPRWIKFLNYKKLSFFLPILLLTVLTVTFFRPFILEGKIPIPADTVIGMYHPWRDVVWENRKSGYPYKNFLITDPVRQQYPWRQISVESILKGNLPLWNPYNGAGEPLLGNFQSAALYPLNLLFFLLPFNLAWGWLVLLQSLLGGIFLYLYLSHLKINCWTSFLGAIVFMFSGFSVAWLTWNTIGHVILWLPLILLAKEHLLEKLSWKWITILVFSESASILAGHLQILFYSLVISNLYLLIRIMQLSYRESLENKRNIVLIALKKYLPFICIGVFVLLITSVQWLPTLEYIQLSSRSIDQLNWQQKEGWFIPWQNLIQFLSPDFFGNPSTLNYFGVWNYGEFIGYISIFPLSLAILVIVFSREKRVRFFGIILLLALLFATPTLLAKIPFSLNIPLIATSQPTRLMVLIDLSLSILSAFGMNLLMQEVDKRKWFSVITFLITGVIGIIWFYLFFQTKFSHDSKMAANLLISRRNLLLPTLISVIIFLTSITLIVFKRRQSLTKTVLGALVLLTIFDLGRFGSKFTPFVQDNLIFPPTQTTTFLTKELSKYPWRMLGVDYLSDQKRILPPNLATSYHLLTPDSYDPLLLLNYQEFIGVSEWGYTSIPKLSFNRMIQINNYSSRLVDLMGVKYIAAIADTVSPKLKFLFREGETRIYENLDVFPRAFMVYQMITARDKTETARMLTDKNINLRSVAILNKELKPVMITNTPLNKVRFLKYESNKVVIEVDTTEAGLLVLTDTYFPSWKVKVDGYLEEIYETDYVFRGVKVPKGIHLVEFYISLI